MGNNNMILMSMTTTSQLRIFNTGRVPVLYTVFLSILSINLSAQYQAKFFPRQTPKLAHNIMTTPVMYFTEESSINYSLHHFIMYLLGPLIH